MRPWYVLATLGLIAGPTWLVWMRAGQASPAFTPQGRRREAGRCAAFLLLTLLIAGSLLPTEFGLFSRALSPVIVLILAVAAVIVIRRPRLAFGLIPTALIVLGGLGLAVARIYGYWSEPGSFMLLPLGQYNMQYYLVLPLAYGALLLGGWLAWRSADHDSPQAHLVLGALAGRDRLSRPWALLLLPVAVIAAQLAGPSITASSMATWIASGVVNLVWTAVVVVGAFLVIRRWPQRAAWLATGGVLALGVAGLVIGRSWQNWPLEVTPNRYVLDGIVAVSSSTMGNYAIAQAVAFLLFGLWLAPRTIGWAAVLLGRTPDAELGRRVQRLTESRAVAVDAAAADLRRLERDLHDGAQARLVALGMNLRAVERLIPTSPEAAIALVAEARETSARALTELRELVRGVHPPVLADRGLGDAIRALALDTPMKIETEIDLPGRLPAPIETACYFAVAEVLTNAAKHSGAREGRICVTHTDGMLRIAATDFGMGGADPARGTGLAGLEKRLAAFDGIVAVSSPVGGPTLVVMEVPCASSWQKISSS